MKQRINHRTSRLVPGIGFIVALALSGCSKDDAADNRLPEGQYPMTFTAAQGEVVASPQTRVSDYDDAGTHKSKWSTGDQIKVTVKENSTGTVSTTTCTLNESGSITSYDPQLYWQTTGNHTINAWYSNITGQNTTSTTVSLADQSSGLAYVMKADELTGKNYQSGNLSLDFKHQLAKVRVKLVKGTTAADLTNATVTIKNQYTSCSISNGAVTGTGTSNGTITMHRPTATNGYYEANIVSGTTLAADCFEITAGSQTVSATTTAIANTAAATMYTFTITVDKPGPLQPVDGKFTIKEGEDVLIKDYEGTAPIVVNGNATITLENSVKINASTHVIDVKDNAKVTLHVIGNGHQLVSSNGCGIRIGNNASIEITGEGRDKSALIVTASENYPYPAIGLDGRLYKGSTLDGINISSISLTATSGKNTDGGNNAPSAIGYGMPKRLYAQICKYVKITNSKVTATSYGGACIGTGTIGDSPITVNEITIQNSELTLKAESGPYGRHGACIGFGAVALNNYASEIKNITITDATFTNCSGNQIVGKGDDPDNLGYPSVIFSSFTVNGQSCSSYWNNANDHN